MKFGEIVLNFVRVIFIFLIVLSVASYRDLFIFIPYHNLLPELTVAMFFIWMVGEFINKK